MGRPDGREVDSKLVIPGYTLALPSGTVLAPVVTSNTALATMPGTAFLPAAATGLTRDSVVNVTALVTLDKSDLTEWVGQVPTNLMQDVERGLRRVLAL